MSRDVRHRGPDARAAVLGRSLKSGEEAGASASGGRLRHIDLSFPAAAQAECIPPPIGGPRQLRSIGRDLNLPAPSARALAGAGCSMRSDFRPQEVGICSRPWRVWGVVGRRHSRPPTIGIGSPMRLCGDAKTPDLGVGRGDRLGHQAGSTNSASPEAGAVSPRSSSI